MVIMTTHRPSYWRELPDRPLTVDDLALLPDEDEYVYELADGRLDVSARPLPRHVRVQTRLAHHLSGVAPEDFEIQVESALLLNSAKTKYRVPDLAVFRAEDWVPDEMLRIPPALAIEVVSDSSATRDCIDKAREYAAFGIQSYWIIEPDPHVPRLVELRLDPGDGSYRRETDVMIDSVFETDVPFPVKIVPYWLVADGPWRELIGGAASG